MTRPRRERFGCAEGSDCPYLADCPECDRCQDCCRCAEQEAEERAMREADEDHREYEAESDPKKYYQGEEE